MVLKLVSTIDNKRVFTRIQTTEDEVPVFIYDGAE
jgi:hypothetical protein